MITLTIDNGAEKKIIRIINGKLLINGIRFSIAHDKSSEGVSVMETSDDLTLTKWERNPAAVLMDEFDVRRVAIAATGDVSEGGFVPVYAENVEQVNEALSMADERASKMRERGDMFAEESRRKAGWLLGERHLVEALTAQLLLAQEALIAAGFTQLSATNRWKPPLGKRPDFEAVDVVDAAREYVANLHAIMDPETRLGFLAAAIDRYDAMKRARELGAALGASMSNACDRMAIDVMKRAGGDVAAGG